jgi:hypothetical protein
VELGPSLGDGGLKYVARFDAHLLRKPRNHSTSGRYHGGIDGDALGWHAVEPNERSDWATRCVEEDT